MTDVDLCWAWWETLNDEKDHHRCMLAGDHPGLCECCCGAKTAFATRTVPKQAACRHCGGGIIPCPSPSPACKGWKHVAYLHYGPLGPHYCQGRSVNPLAEPAA